jgi:hypothetical protein
VAWPVVARAQQANVPVIGFLTINTESTTRTLAPFLQGGVHEQDFVEGRNVEILSRYAETLEDRLPALAADLVQQRIAAIFVTQCRLRPDCHIADKQEPDIDSARTERSCKKIPPDIAHRRFAVEKACALLLSAPTILSAPPCERAPPSDFDEALMLPQRLGRAATRQPVGMWTTQERCPHPQVQQAKISIDLIDSDSFS